MAKVWRIQGTQEMERHPSWDGWRSVDPEEPADPEWPGYWWATGTDPWTKDTYFLIRASDLERARSGEEVDTYCAGLYGCTDPSELLLYIKSNIGGVLPDDNLFVALYEGRIIDRSEDGVVFRPVELLQVWPAYQWCQMQEQE